MPINAIPSAPAVRQPRANTSSAKPKTTSTQNVKSKTDQRAEGLLGIAQVGHTLLLLSGQYADAGAVQHFAPNLCVETAKLAEGHESLAKGIDYLSEVGPYTAILTAVVPFALQIAVNHKRISPDKVAGSGVLHPDILEARVKADIERQRLEALKAQREAEEAYRKAYEDLESQE